MNGSGKEIKSLTTDYRLMTNDLLVVHDDMDLPLGKFKLQFGKSAAGHKGVQSIIDALGTKDFWRLRIGIGNPPAGVTAEEFVLSPLSKQELKVLEGVFAAAADDLSVWILSAS